jgi:hypothetical protein
MLDWRRQDGHIYLPEQQYKLYSGLRGYQSLIVDHFSVRLCELDFDGKMWVELDTIEPQDIRDTIIADLENMYDEKEV